MEEAERLERTPDALITQAPNGVSGKGAGQRALADRCDSLNLRQLRKSRPLGFLHHACVSTIARCARAMNCGQLLFVRTPLLAFLRGSLVREQVPSLGGAETPCTRCEEHDPFWIILP